MSRSSLSERIYRRLLRLFPIDFRIEYREEMEELFRLQHRRASASGRFLHLLRLWLRSASDLLRSAPREHWEALAQDVRYTLRSARRAPGLMILVAATFALAVGANTAIYTVADATLLRPLPLAQEERLVRLVHVRERPDGSLSEVSFSRRDYHAVLDQAASVEAATAQVYQGPALETTDGVQRVVSIGVSGSWFRTLGLEPSVGRTWDRAEERDGRDSRVVVLSDGLWRHQFGADPQVVGRTILLDGDPYTVLGVMPRGFAYPYGAQMWRLWDFDPEESGSHNLNVQARLAPGVTLSEAQAELDLISQRQAEAYPETSRGFRIGARPTRENLIEGEDRLVLVLLAGVGLVLLIASANVLGLLMARTVARSRELAVRASLGASAWRRARQLMTENVILALVGGGAGMACAAGLRRPLTALLPNHVQELFGSVPIDTSTVGFAAAISLAVGVGVGLFAAWSSRSIDLRGVLQGSRERPSGHRLLDGMVIAQTAMTVALLVGAVLLSLDLYRVGSRDPGFDTRGLLAARLSFPESKYGEGKVRLHLEEGLIERIEALPGVERAAIANLFPYDDGNWLIPFRLGDETLPPDQSHMASLRQVTPGFFEALGIPLLQGRRFDSGDRDGTLPVAVVDRALAERYWPGENPVGRQLTAVSSALGGHPIQVVGVVGDVEDPRREPAETVYLPMAQTSVDAADFDIVQPVLALRTTFDDPVSVIPSVRSAVRQADPTVPLFAVRTSTAALRAALAQQRMATTLALVFAGAGLLLAAIGTYGVVAYRVARDLRAFGVRIALGASRGSVLRAVLLRGGKLAAGGVGIGLVASVALSRLFADTLLAVDPSAPAPYATVAVLLVVIGLAASLQPALRAIRVDPVSILKET